MKHLIIELTNAGHITYIELDGDPSTNLDAFEKVIRYMKAQGIGYGSINHPVDRDPGLRLQRHHRGHLPEMRQK